MTAIRTLAVSLAAALVLLLAAPGYAADPANNTSPSGLFNCNPNTSAISDACLSGAVSDFNRGRAVEHLSGINLPANFRSLPASYQILILENIDRADRGLPQFLGLSKTLNSYALTGAQTDSDPPFPSWTSYGAGNWAGTVNALWAGFDFVYNDGYGSNNLDCTSATDTGCWGHRHNVLMSWPSPLIMGAATANGGMSTLVLGRDTHDTADQFMWASEFAQFPHRAQPTIGISGGTGVLHVSITHESQTTLTIQRYYSGAWHTIGHHITGGTTRGAATWSGSFNVAAGTYRVASTENSRFLKAMSGSTAVH